MTYLSSHFTLAEATVSETASRLGINNTPESQIITTMRQTAMAMESIRDLLGSPIHVNSWYRSPALNASLGSAVTSQHLLGEAVDFICPSFGTPYEICKLLVNNKTIHFDQLILEHTWVHISFVTSRVPRRQVLSLLSNGHYASGLTDAHGIPFK